MNLLDLIIENLGGQYLKVVFYNNLAFSFYYKDPSKIKVFLYFNKAVYTYNYIDYFFMAFRLKRDMQEVIRGCWDFDFN